MNKDDYIKIAQDKLKEIKQLIPSVYICNLDGKVIIK